MDPTLHLNLLRRHERALGLQAAIADAVRPGARVLDAGCGVGLLSLWAVAAGAGEVVAVDLEGIALAEQIAAENGVSGKVSFLETDLWKVTTDELGRFDVILGMLYLNDPRRDRAASALVHSLKDRFLVEDGQVLPDRVRCTARPVDWPDQDLPTRLDGIKRQVADLEQRYALRLSSLQRAASHGAHKSWFPGKLSDGTYDPGSFRVLGPRSLVHDVNYTHEPTTFPQQVDLVISQPGKVTAVVWTQDLIAGQKLLFSNESVSWLTRPQQVTGDDVVSLDLGSRWDEDNVVTAQVRASR